jgi:hypothetical protein
VSGMKLKGKCHPLCELEWNEIWEEFEKKYDSREFCPRNSTQQAWIAKIVNAKLKELYELKGSSDDTPK